MKAREVSLLVLLKNSPQFKIPIYQRTYSWTEAECAQLWDDIIRAGTDERINAHFVGSVVYIEEGLYQISSQHPVLVIDGQQRLTTVSLILEALARQLSAKEETIGEFSARKIRNYHLLNPEEGGERHFKLILTQTDKTSLLALLEQREPPEDESIRLLKNFQFFENKVKGIGDLRPLCQGLAKLMAVDIALSRGQDNPQLIFESMNATGLKLGQADLIRNFILMALEPEQQSRLYENHWRPMEVAFGQEAYAHHFDSFMRHYLTVRMGGDIPRIRDVYARFKEYSARRDGGVESLLEDIKIFAQYYCAIALKKEEEPRLADAFGDLRELKKDVAYPLLLELYHDYKQEKLGLDDFVCAIRLIESYIFRRAVCEMATNTLNTTFATFARNLDEDRYLESIRAHFQLLTGRRRFPGDKEFMDELKRRNSYNFKPKEYLLRKLENDGHERKEKVVIGEYTIEHIMPQNPDLSREWRNALGENWEEVHSSYLHTLGNLTLTGYNSEYSDHPFERKRDMEGGFRDSPILLNRGLGQLETWGETQIKERANRLTELALKVWRAPGLAEDVLGRHRPEPRTQQEYSIEDHRYLAGGVTRSLFDLLGKEILAIDPCVKQEYRKLYIAYKAETNFVDVIPQANQLRLIINLDFDELVDPKGIAKDVTNLGKWGNGNVELALTSEDEITYAMSLIRQAFEKQVGN